MDDKVIIEFAKWITGHDEETIIQMYDDWASSPARQAIQVQAKVSVKTADFDAIIKDAFDEGETWGTCYGGWFEPTPERHKTDFEESKKKIKDKYNL